MGSDNSAAASHAAGSAGEDEATPVQAELNKRRTENFHGVHSVRWIAVTQAVELRSQE